MKTRRACILLSSAILISAIILFSRYFSHRKTKLDELELWMTYDEVSKIVPLNKEKVEYNPMVAYRIKDETQKKYAAAYHFNLEKEYGVHIGFNLNYEVVYVYRITRAKVHNPSGSVPVFR